MRAVTDPDYVDAEFGVIVRSDLEGQGLGMRLMHKLLRALLEQGTRRVVGTVQAENERVQALACSLGFVDDSSRAGNGAPALRSG